MNTETIHETKLLYDDVRQLLYSIMLGFQSSELQKMDPKVQKHFTQLKESTYELFGEIQRNASHSQYLILSSFGFLTAIRKWVKYCEDLLSIQVLIVTEGIEEDERWSEEQELTLYLLCREWILQTLRHMTSKHGELSLVITKVGDEFQLFFHTPNLAKGEEWWCMHVLQHTCLSKDLMEYNRSVKVLMQESGMTIIASLIDK